MDSSSTSTCASSPLTIWPSLGDGKGVSPLCSTTSQLTQDCAEFWGVCPESSHSEDCFRFCVGQEITRQGWVPSLQTTRKASVLNLVDFHACNPPLEDDGSTTANHDPTHGLLKAAASCLDRRVKEHLCLSVMLLWRHVVIDCRRQTEIHQLQQANDQMRVKINKMIRLLSKG